MPLNLQVFRQDLVYQATAPVNQLVADLNQIQVIDLAAEHQKATFTKMLVGSIIGAFVSFVLTITVPLLGVPLLLVCVGLAVYAGILVRRYGQFDLANYRYEFAKRLLGMLDRDTEQHENYRLNAVFSKPNKKQKKSQTIPHPNRQGWKVDVFHDPWLNLQGEFLDGTRFQVEIVELYQTAYGWKRGSSGKSKYKTKSKSKGFDVQVSLSYSRRKYGAIQVLQRDVEAAIQLPVNARLRDLDITDKGLQLSVKLRTNPSALSAELTEVLYQTVTMMFLSLYQILNLARVLSKKKEA